VKVCTICGTEYPDDQSFCPADGSALKSTGGVADMVGSIVADQYRILKKLGEGGMGAVYLAEHVKMGRKTAIKVISRSLAEDPDAIARFNREAANAAKINHPNVCAVYDFGDTPDGVIYLAMEFIEGESLTDLVNREGALPPRRAARIVSQTAEALDAAHAFGIVHRDLKPDNIMITKSRDGADFAKVVDFGIAKAAGGDEKQNVTKTGLVVGTPEYMSPEQLSGDKVDGRSDIYSLALVAFRMLTGSLPFPAETAQEVMIMRLTNEPQRLDEAAPGVDFPPALQQVLDQGLKRMPQDRYASAARFGADLVKAVSGMPEVAPAVDVDGATQLLDSSEITDQVGGLGGVTEAMPGTRAAAHGQPAPTPDTPMPPTAMAPVGAAEEGKQRKKPPVAAIAAVVGAVVIGGGGAVMVMGGGDSEAAPGDSLGQIARDPVTQNTETVSDTGEGSRPGDAVVPPSEQRQAQRDRGVPADSGQEVTGTRTDDPETTTPARANPAWMSLAGAEDHLVDLVIRLEGASPQTVEMARDTAVFYYDAEGLDDVNRALAAYVAATASDQLGDRATALDWIRLSVTLNPDDNAAQTLLQALERGGSQ
jgi:serine/threonine-protein kinase